MPRRLVAVFVIGASLVLLFRLGSFIVAVPPSPWPYLGFALLWGGALAAVSRGSARARAATAGVVTLALFVFGSVPLHSRERLLLDLAEIEPGMTQEEVSRAMTGYWHGILVDAAYRQKATPETELAEDGCEVFRHSNSSYDWDWGMVCFADGRVTRTRFSPD